MPRVLPGVMHTPGSTRGARLAAAREPFHLILDAYRTWCSLLPRTGTLAFEITGGS